LEKAKKEGAMALFGEKYGAEVRTISIGANGDADGERFSYELCGGTHVEHTSDIGLFLITSEGSAAAGIRRIEAVTGRAAYALTEKRNAALADAARALKATSEEVPGKLAALQADLNQVTKQLSELKRAKAQEGMQDVLANVPLVAGIPLLTAAIPGADANALRQLVDQFRNKYPSGVALLAGLAEGRATLIAAVTKDLVARGLNAGELVKLAAEPLGGSGGGKPELAQAGGEDNGHVADALAVAKAWVEGKIT
jgi:alanyl-tRNA synthetase